MPSASRMRRRSGDTRKRQAGTAAAARGNRTRPRSATPLLVSIVLSATRCAPSRVFTSSSPLLGCATAIAVPRRRAAAVAAGSAGARVRPPRRGCRRGTRTITDAPSATRDRQERVGADGLDQLDRAGDRAAAQPGPASSMFSGRMPSVISSSPGPATVPGRRARRRPAPRSADRRRASCRRPGMQIHRRAADEDGDEGVGGAAVDLARRARPAARRRRA